MTVCIMIKTSHGLHFDKVCYLSTGEVSIVVEDIAVSCDVQQVYCKVKTTVGNVSIHNFIHR